jgi:hypothetical protein
VFLALGALRFVRNGARCGLGASIHFTRRILCPFLPIPNHPAFPLLHPAQVGAVLGDKPLAVAHISCCEERHGAP